ncbi:hypothetical protein DFQ14_11017 [Halopolyspora algeriensis]|uniref:TrbL/VirB6 plasmid conjugal transfer protein n=1 Tax=Halopolyspora algeriensis TaxID=1500506 RepID=A0A368VNL0_9ACTN|nr:hypothetical protein [Halopolyspora algeriensis]RCW40693.1 hypothetical protein DFQ14_11017 [Halopolyspora algeriensis]TQM53384.1 hypothetical protein FHU43_2781 [Halopolyspora algeriensis]
MWLVVIALVAAAVLVRARRAANTPVVRSRHADRRGALLLVSAIVGMQVLVGVPASAQPFDCTEPPNPERPGAGMVGALDPAPIGVGQSGSAYDLYGYAGQVWHTYDLGCGPQGVTNPNALVGTWIGNQLFNVAKNLVGATNGLHYALLSGNILAPLDDVVATGTVALYDSVFTPWFGLAALILAVVLFRYIWQGDLATIGKRTMWALAALWFASATYLTPLVYTHALDEVVITGTSAVQGGFLEEVGVDERDALPTLLHNEVVYRNWLRGEFGTPDSPKAQQLGMELLAAQAWSKEEVLAGEDAGSAEEKKRAFEEVASKMGSAYGYFRGVQGSRIGAGMLAMLQGFAYTSFQLLAKAAILLAQVLLRVLILAGPLIGLVALLYHEVLRTVGRVAGAALLNVVVIAAMAGMHTLVLSWVFDPARGFSALTRILLAGLLTIVFLMLGKPLRRMGQMIELSVGAAGGAMPRVPSSVFSRFGGRSRGERRAPQDDFWDQVRESEPDDGSAPPPRGRRRRVRPESEAPSVAATAQRMDRENMPPELSTGPPPAGAAGQEPPSAAGGTGRQRPGAAGRTNALPQAPGTSRAVDTAPVVDATWDTHGEDAVLVPSRAGAVTPSEVTPSESPGTRRRPDPEVVAGKPVNVIYHPTRGLEVTDG